MSKSIKSISVIQVQEAIAKALSELTGNTCKVSISQASFDGSFFDTIAEEGMSFSAKAEFGQGKVKDKTKGKDSKEDDDELF
ncbi:MAG: hypothetical protein ACXW1W_02810 [Methylococcaceae bacterium]